MHNNDPPHACFAVPINQANKFQIGLDRKLPNQFSGFTRRDGNGIPVDMSHVRMTAHPAFVLLNFFKLPKIEFVIDCPRVGDDKPDSGPFFNVDRIRFEQHISCGGFLD